MSGVLAVLDRGPQGTKKPDFLSGFIGRRHGREIRIPGSANTADN